MNDLSELDLIGWHRDIGGEQYHHEMPGVSSSGLKTFKDRPGAYFLYDKLNPTPPSWQQKIGLLFHAMVLEPETVERDFVKVPVFKGTGSVQAKKDWYADNKGRHHISVDHWATCDKMLINARKKSTFLKLLGDPSRFVAESSVFWHDPETGELCKVRPDALPYAVPLIVDVKVTSSVASSAFARRAADFSYSLSAAMYLDGVSKTPDIANHFGFTYSGFIFAVFEYEPPHECRFFEFSIDDLRHGYITYRRTLDLFIDAKNAGFPGYLDNIETLTLPAYSRKLPTL